jgi:hypothetical protein
MLAGLLIIQMPNSKDSSTFIGYQTVHTSLERSAFCWRPHWSSRFESLWSLLRKFAHLNAINHYEVLKLFKCNDVSQRIDHSRWCLRADLRHFGALDPLRLSTILGSDGRDIAEATVLKFVQEHEAGILTSEFLRFCPTCIYQGFHSPIHQLLFLANCPAHGDRLVIRCTECFTLTIPYKILSVSSEDLSNCAHMTYGLSQHLTHSDVGKLQKEATKRERALLPIAKLLMMRVEISAAEQLITQSTPTRMRQRHVPHHLGRLLGYWVEVFRSNFSKRSFKIPKATSIHIQVSHRETPRSKGARSGVDLEDDFPWKAAEAWDLELYKIYKAIDRHLRQCYLSYHRRCIVIVGNRFGWYTSDWTRRGRICPAANALLLWRMLMEGVGEPYMLFQPRRRSWDGHYRPRINWVSPSDTLPNWVLRRIFALECLGFFHECLLLAEALYRGNVYSFQLMYVKGRRRLHWLIEKGESGNWIIHWWVPRPLSSVFNQSSWHFNSCDTKTSAGEWL